MPLYSEIQSDEPKYNGAQWRGVSKRRRAEAVQGIIKRHKMDRELEEGLNTKLLRGRDGEDEHGDMDLKWYKKREGSYLRHEWEAGVRDQNNCSCWFYCVLMHCTCTLMIISHVCECFILYLHI